MVVFCLVMKVLSSSFSFSSWLIISLSHAPAGLFSYAVAWLSLNTQFLSPLNRTPPAWLSSFQSSSWFTLLCFCRSLSSKSSLSSSQHNFIVSATFILSPVSSPSAFFSAPLTPPPKFFPTSNSSSVLCKTGPSKASLTPSLEISSCCFLSTPNTPSRGSLSRQCCMPWRTPSLTSGPFSVIQVKASWLLTQTFIKFPHTKISSALFIALFAATPSLLQETSHASPSFSLAFLQFPMPVCAFPLLPF